MKRFLLIITTLGALIADAQTFKNVDEVVDYLRSNNPGLRAESFNAQVAQQNIRSAWSMLMPQVRAFASLDNNISLPVQLIPAEFLGGQEGQFREVQFGTRYNSAYSAEVSLNLFNASDWKNISAARNAAKASSYQYKDTELRTIESATSAYYMALLSREGVNISNNLFISADSLLKAAEIRFKQGTIEQMDYNRVRSIYLDALDQLKTFETSYTNSILALKTATGIALTDSIDLTEDISEILVSSPDATEELNVRLLPRYNIFNYRKLQADKELRSARLRALPTISAYGRYSRQTFSNEFDIFSPDQTWYDIGVVGLKAEWVLFTGFNRNAMIRKASLRSQAADLELKNNLLQSEKENKELQNNYNTARATIQLAAEDFQLCKESYLIAGIKYDGGVYTIDQYVNIYQELVKAQNKYLSNLASLLIYESIIKTRKDFR